MKNQDEKLQYDKYDINREAAKISALSSGKIDKYEYQNRIIVQAKFTCSPLGKAFEKQIKAIEEPGEKQIKSLKEHGKQLVKF